MKTLDKSVSIAAAALLCAMCAAPAFAQEKAGQGTAIVTIVPKKDSQAAANVSAQAVQLKVNGKDATVSQFVHLQGANNPVELVVLLDSSSRESLGRQLDDISHFIQGLPPNVKVGVAYMSNGASQFGSPLSADHAQVVKALHLPGGVPGGNASPYFCISDLAKRWPSQDRAARREVLMVTDGVDEYNRRYDPEDPYVQAAMNDATRAGIVLYSIYWRGQGFADNTQYANNTGQNLLTQVTETTGGRSFYEGTGNPVSFQPYLDELAKRLQNQYELSFTVPFNGKPQVESMHFKINAPGNEVEWPHQVYVGQGVAQE